MPSRHPPPCLHLPATAPTAALPPQVGRKPFNIKESESLRYVHLPLQSAPGLKDPRCGPAPGRPPGRQAWALVAAALVVAAPVRARCASCTARRPLRACCDVPACPQTDLCPMLSWLDLSPDAKHLVMGMLAYDPARRLTMQQARAAGTGALPGVVLGTASASLPPAATRAHQCWADC